MINDALEKRRWSRNLDLSSARSRVFRLEWHAGHKRAAGGGLHRQVHLRSGVRERDRILVIHRMPAAVSQRREVDDVRHVPFFSPDVRTRGLVRYRDLRVERRTGSHEWSVDLRTEDTTLPESPMPLNTQFVRCFVFFARTALFDRTRAAVITLLCGCFEEPVVQTVCGGMGQSKSRRVRQPIL